MGEWFAAPLILGMAPEGALITAGASGLTAGAGISGLTAIAGPSTVGLGGLFGTGLGPGDVVSGVGALSSLAGGVQGAQAADFSRMQFEEEAANARTAAAQDETQRLRRLRSTLATQNALRAGRGVELFGGGTGEAIRQDTIGQTQEDIETSRLNYLSKARRFDLAAGQESIRGRSAILGGIGGAATALSPSFRT